MIVLGLNAYHADSSAAIFVNGELLVATEEERFRRVKHWAGFPTEAIKFCLREAGCTLEDVTAITIGRDLSAKRDRKARFVLGCVDYMLCGYARYGRMSRTKRVEEKPQN